MDFGPINVNMEGGMDYPFPPLIPVDQRFQRRRLPLQEYRGFQLVEQARSAQIVWGKRMTD